VFGVLPWEMTDFTFTEVEAMHEYLAALRKGK